MYLSLFCAAHQRPPGGRGYGFQHARSCRVPETARGRHASGNGSCFGSPTQQVAFAFGFCGDRLLGMLRASRDEESISSDVTYLKLNVGTFFISVRRWDCRPTDICLLIFLTPPPMLVHVNFGDSSTYQALVDDVLDHRLNRVTVQMEGKNGQGKRSKTYDVDAESVRTFDPLRTRSRTDSMLESSRRHISLAQIFYPLWTIFALKALKRNVMMKYVDTFVF